MRNCENKCKSFVSENDCKHCQENYDVSDIFYMAERDCCSAKVVGYLVKRKGTDEILGIFSVSTFYHELAYIKESTLEIYEG